MNGVTKEHLPQDVREAVNDGADLFPGKGETFAKWRDSNGKTRIAPVTTAVNGSLRIMAK